MTPTVTVHADPALGSVALHIVIGGPGVQPNTIVELLKPGAPAQQVAGPTQSANIDLPILIAPQYLPGCSLGCQVTLAGLVPNSSWAVTAFATQGSLNLGAAVDHGVLASGATISTVWIIFQ